MALSKRVETGLIIGSVIVMVFTAGLFFEWAYTLPPLLLLGISFVASHEAALLLYSERSVRYPLFVELTLVQLSCFAVLLLTRSDPSSAFVFLCFITAFFVEIVRACASGRSDLSRFWPDFTFRLPLVLFVLVGTLIALYLSTSREGILLLFVVAAATAAADIGAYYTGKACGSRPLAPAISPKKTVEGAIGGILAAVVVGSLAGITILDYQSVYLLPLQFVFIAIAGQCGDLFVSAYKRRRNLKDTSTLLPGHGGVLDRIDSHLLGIPVAYLVLGLWV